LADLFFESKQLDPNWLANYPIPAQGAKIMMDVQHAKFQLDSMHAKICKRTFSLTMAFFNRKFRQISRGIYL